MAVLPSQEGRNGEVIALLQVGRDLDAVDILDQLGIPTGGIEADEIAALGGPVGGNGHFPGIGEAAFDGGVVHGHDVITLGAVGAGGGILHELEGILLRDDAGKTEERGLQDGIDAAAQSSSLPMAPASMV